jgi:hypothetical protein
MPFHPTLQGSLRDKARLASWQATNMDTLYDRPNRRMIRLAAFRAKSRFKKGNLVTQTRIQQALLMLLQGISIAILNIDAAI